MFTTTKKYLIIAENDPYVYCYRDTFEAAMKVAERMVEKEHGTFNIYALEAKCEAISQPRWTIMDKRTNKT